MIFFLCFGFVAVVPGDPETQTVSHFLPETLRRVAKKFRTDAEYRAGRCDVFRLISRERIPTTGTVFGSAPAMRCRLSNREMVSLCGITHRT
jgi:hypothetical protein